MHPPVLPGAMMHPFAGYMQVFLENLLLLAACIQVFQMYPPNPIEAVIRPFAGYMQVYYNIPAYSFQDLPQPDSGFLKIILDIPMQYC